MIRLEIKQKYFNAIACGDKNIEIRHEPIEPYSLVKLVCDGVGEITFISGDCLTLDAIEKKWSMKKEEYLSKINDQPWFDEFCKTYIDKKESYFINIRKIINLEWYGNKKN